MTVKSVERNSSNVYLCCFQSVTVKSVERNSSNVYLCCFQSVVVKSVERNSRNMYLCLLFSVCDCKEYREELTQHVPGATPAAGAAS